MAAPLRYRVLFALHRHDRELDPQLQCRVKWGSSRFIVTVNTGYRVNPERWDAAAQRCVSGSFHGARRIPASTINAEIVRYRDAVDAVFADFSDREVFPSVPDVRAALHAKLSADASVQASEDVFVAFDRFCSEQGTKNSWSDASYMKMRVVRRHLQAWRPALQWSDFDEAGLASYVAFLRDDRGHKNSTLDKQMGYLRWFLNWAEARGLCSADFRQFRPHLKAAQRPVIYLTWDELMRLWEWDASADPFRGQVRDIFCFCCFTSLRYSDAMNLRWPDVSETSFSLTTVKTAEPLTIQLNRWSQDILWRFLDESYEDRRVFPPISNQVMNRNIHDLCKECGIDSPVHLTWYSGAVRHDEVRPKYELVSTHAGRRTFVCLALGLGISSDVVREWTGHADERAMAPYKAISNSAKAEAMSLFDGIKKRHQ